MKNTYKVRKGEREYSGTWVQGMKDWIVKEYSANKKKTVYVEDSSLRFELIALLEKKKDKDEN